MNPLDLIRALLGGGQPTTSSGGRGGTPDLPMPLQPMQGAEPDRTWGELASFLDLLDDPGIAANRQLTGGDTRGGYEAIWRNAQTAFMEGGAYESPYADAGIGERLLGGAVVPGGGAADMIQGISSGVRAIPAILSGAGDALGAIRSGDNVMEVLSELVRRPADRRNPAGGEFSFDPNTGEMAAADAGFTVGGFADEVSLDTRLIGPEVIDAYRASNAEVLEQPGALLGGWLNAEDGRGYLDVSRVIPDRETALSLATDMRQLAVWDVANRESISTGIRRGAVDTIEAARYEAANLPPTITGHPRFDVIRRDVETLTALGFDPTQWERAGSGMVLPRPLNAASDRTYAQVRETIEANKDTTLRMFEAGRAQGAVRWYDNQEILDLTVEAFEDPVVSRTLFDMLMEVEGVASAGSTVPQQTKRASWLWYQLANGVPPSQINLKDLPAGLGNMTWSTSQGIPFSRFDTGASPFSADALKTGNYTGNLQGQGAPFTADRWMPRMMTNQLDNRTIQPPGGVTYTAYADAAAEMAAELGVSPRDFQAAVWVGAGTVMNPESFRQVFLNGIYRAADERGITPVDAMRQFYTGDISVTHIMGHDTTDDLRRRAARMLAMATPAQEEDETGESNMRLLEMLQGGF